MRSRNLDSRGSAFLGAALALVIVGGLNAGLVGAQTVPPTVFTTTLVEPNQKTEEVSTDELRKILDDHSAYVFDARPLEEYAVSHIPGALNVAQKPGTPLSLYISDVAEIGRLVPDMNAAIVLYCNGPFCGKSKRLSDDLLAAGYTSVRRYQLGAPMWRALGGVMQIEHDAIGYFRTYDQTAVWLDARTPDEFGGGSLPGAHNLSTQNSDIQLAKDDGRLPNLDHNTRIIVFGNSGIQARALAEEVARNAFHNVAYFGGSFDELDAVALGLE